MAKIVRPFRSRLNLILVFYLVDPSKIIMNSQAFLCWDLIRGSLLKTISAFHREMKYEKNEKASKYTKTNVLNKTNLINLISNFFFNNQYRIINFIPNK
jgi:hypothetical protein